MKSLLHSLESRLARVALLCAVLLCLSVGVTQALGPGAKFAGRVLFRGTKMAAPGVTVELVEAEDNGEPKDEVLATTKADAEGRFTVSLLQPTKEPVVLVVYALRTSADSGGDRRQEGYEIKTKRIVLGFLPHPSPVKPNTLFIERRKVQRPGEDD